MSDNKDNSTKILKLKFGKDKDETKEAARTKNEGLDKKTSEQTDAEQKNLRGIPQIIKSTPPSTNNKSRPFKKKTFIPRTTSNENKFAIKTPPKKTHSPGFKPNDHNKLTKRPPFMKPTLNVGPNIFQKPGNSPFEKKNNNETIKKKKGLKKESTKPKNNMFSNIVGNNFIGKIEGSTLEESEFFTIRKGKKNFGSSQKNKDFLQKTIELETELSLKELANMLSTKLEDVEKQARYIGYEENKEAPLVNIEILEIIATSLGHKVIRKDTINQEKFDVFNIKIDESNAEKRPPIVAIVGHVDHGKTSLLDKIRKTNLVKTEAGGITQKTAGYSISTKNGDITFIDTPGHAAFSNMRKRGININDISILVISATEGVKNQTIESIKHIKQSKTQLIVAATKSDLPNTNLDKIKQDLAKHEILVKEYGGDIELIEVSSVTGHNIDLLLQTILAYADIMELKANVNTNAIGVVLDSKIDPKVGVLSTILVQQGTIKIGDTCATLHTFGKIKGITTDLNKKVKQAIPGMTVEVLGINECPTPGEKFAVMDHSLAVELTKKTPQKEQIQNKISLADLFEKEKPTLNLILNADTQGALEALNQILEGLDTAHSSYKIIKKSVGKIKDSDFDVAKLTDATILNYNLSIGKDLEQKAKTENVPIISSKIIYEIEDLVKQKLDQLITLVEEEIYIGTAVVKRIFKSSKIGNISGCMVTDGKITRDLVAKVLRRGKIMFEGKVESLKKQKDDVKEVTNGLECGIFVNYKDIAEEDEIMCYKIEYKKPD